MALTLTFALLRPPRPSTAGPCSCSDSSPSSASSPLSSSSLSSSLLSSSSSSLASCFRFFFTDPACFFDRLLDGDVELRSATLRCCIIPISVIVLTLGSSDSQWARRRRVLFSCPNLSATIASLRRGTVCAMSTSSELSFSRPHRARHQVIRESCTHNLRFEGIMQVLENVLGELDFARVTREHPTLVFRPVLDKDLGDLRETIEVLERVSGVHDVRSSQRSTNTHRACGSFRLPPQCGLFQTLLLIRLEVLC